MRYIQGKRWPAPTTHLAHALHREIQKGLPENEKRKLHLYDALGYALDTDFSIDGFYEWNDRIVPFDLTLRSVDPKPKGGLVIRKDDLEYPPNREKLGQTIAEKLLQTKPWRALPRHRHSYLN